MKRALAICASLLVFGAAGFGFSISGSWDATLEILPDVGLSETTLVLNYELDMWTISSTSVFTGDDGFVTQGFTLSGDLGLLDVSGTMNFDPTIPAYLDMDLGASMSFLGLLFSVDISHEIVDPEAQTPSAIMEYDFGLAVDNYNLTFGFYDECEGIMFNHLTFTGTGLPLCCGVTYDFEFYFDKLGFQYMTFTFADFLTIFDYWTLDVGITYGVDYKDVSLDWDFDGPVGVCVEFFLDSDGLFDISFTGFKITCELDTCDSFSYEMNLGWVDWLEEEAWTDQTLGLEFCGPACCGQDYLVYVDLIWENVENPGLFGLTEFAGGFDVGLFEGFSLNSSIWVDLLGVEDTELTLGWTFTF